MDLAVAGSWTPPEHWTRFVVIDAHTGGEPFRLVVDGLPEIPGDSMGERRRYAQRHLDHIRRILMWEPRGHADMYGGFLGSPTTPGADLSVLFCHNDGFSTMCGHGVIALTKVVFDLGIMPSREGENRLEIDTPAGRVTAYGRVRAGSVEAVRFRNVASYVEELDARVEVPGLGEVRYDLAFGGAYYAYVDAERHGIDLSRVDTLIPAGRAIKRAVSMQRRIDHPTDPDLGFLYGVVFVGPPRDRSHHSRHVCVFADGEVDRSPTGTAVSGRLAILYTRGSLGLGEAISVESITGSVFDGRIVDVATVGNEPAVVPEVAGAAHLVGRAELWVDPSDPLGTGFLLR
ncbi:MAG: proline racemase [Acidimicrobiia bacterium]|nr:MAG: proline racemase [Acidimicrobiia bacterium]